MSVVHPQQRGNMKKIEAIVRTEMIKSIRQSLLHLGISNMALLEVRSLGNLKGATQIYRGTRFQPDYLLLIKVEVFVADQVADAALAAMTKAVQGEQPHIGRIYVSNVEEAALDDEQASDSVESTLSSTNNRRVI